jgi:hypothetical protein
MIRHELGVYVVRLDDFMFDFFIAQPPLVYKGLLIIEA